MPKFFAPRENISENEIIIDNEDVGHITRVLRLDTGDSVEICDGMGNDYTAVIAAVEKKRIVCTIAEKRRSDTEPDIEVTLFQGIPKSSKMEYIIQKTTELGIVRIVPCVMSRCVSRLDGKEDKKCERWRKIAEAAAKQSGRGIIPEVCGAVEFKDAVDMMKQSDLCFAPYECETHGSLKNVLTSHKNVKTISFMVGPEGGYDISEVEYLHKNDVPTVTLGKRILRTETAGEAVLSMVMYELGDIN